MIIQIVTIIKHKRFFIVSGSIIFY